MARRSLGAAILLLLLIGSFAIAMVRENPNENMYVTAGFLLFQGKSLYADFAYLQTPVLPHVYGGLYQITGAGHYLLKAKLLTWLLWLLSIFLMHRIARPLTHDAWLAFALCVLFALNHHMLRILWETSNYVLAMTLSLAALTMLLRARRHDTKSGPLVASGALAALGVGTKLYYLAATAPLALVSCFVSRTGWRERLGRGLAPMTLGLLLGSIPVLYYLLRDPELFWFNNVQFHWLSSEWRELFGYERAMDPASKAAWILDEVLLRASSLALLGVGLGALGAACWRPRHRDDARDEPEARSFRSFALGVGTLLFVASAAAACFPTPSWPQYFAMPVPYAILVIAALSGAAAARGRRVIGLLVWVGIGISVPGSGMIEALPQVASPERWVAMRHRAEARWVSERLGPDPRGPVATLAPIRVIEADLPIYLEFATGPFLFSVGYALTEEQRARTVATSRSTLFKTFAEKPPAAILVGLYGDAWGEQQLRRYALIHGFQAVRSPVAESGTLYVPPDAAARAERSRRSDRR